MPEFPGQEESMPEFTQTIEVDRPAGECFRVAQDFKAYRNFIPALKSVEVDLSDAIKPVVTFSIEAPLGDITYKVRYEIQGEGRMSWAMIESNVLKANSGYWAIEPSAGGKSSVTYSMSAAFPAWIAWAVPQSKFEEQIGKTVKRFKAYVENSQ